MDIDEILREADPEGASPDQEIKDLQVLTRLWVAERSSPELLRYPADPFIPRLQSRIQEQVVRLEELTTTLDPSATFPLVVLQTELERIKYLLRSWLRARLAKIDRHPLYYLAGEQIGRLSELEVAYATRHQALLHGHYLTSFLAAVPAHLQNLNDPSSGGSTGAGSMVEAPDRETPVVIRLLRDTVFEARGTEVDQVVEGRCGDVFVARWTSVHSLVAKGEAELV